MSLQSISNHAPAHSWKIVGRHELRELWGGSKGLLMLLGYAGLMSVMAYAAASDADLNLLDARESVGIVVQVAIGLRALAAMVVSADAISGERERGTLESLLVTPVSRRGLVIGKLLAATSMWVAALAVAVPYTLILADGPGVTTDALGVLIIVGSLVSIALTALGLAVSALSMSNRTSLAVSVGLLLILAAPSQLPAITADGVVGSLLIRANPVSAGLTLANEVLIVQMSWASQWTLIVAPAIAAIALTVVAIAQSRRLELGGAR